MVKILVLASRFPYPLEKGDKLRIFHAIRLLSLDNEIHLAYISEREISQDLLSQIKPYIQSSLFISISWTKRLLLGLRHSIGDDLPLQVAWTNDEYYKRKLQDYASKIQPDVVFCQLIRMAEYARYLNIPKVIDYMDAFSISMTKRSKVASFPLNFFYSRESKLLAKYEFKVRRWFDCYITISDLDALSLGLKNNQAHMVIPNGVDADYFKIKEPLKMPSFDLGFVGNLSYLPNIQAVEYLHKNIFQRDKGFKILVSGAQPSNRIKKLKEKNFVIRGWVDDIRKSYSEICIFVAPIFAGTGQQNKILEAMSLEIPCITTTAVNKAIGAKNGDNILIADTPNQFLEKINLIKSDPLRAKTLGRNGRKFVLNHFTWLNHVQLLKKSFNKAIYEHSRKKDSV